ncbi:putative glycoside hydrolase [Brevundimonas sp.]|uniref:putative glycoside hydrolase n=1 Tax=Brevundimonas sp. TaxID=1871086 RepID=UPI002ABC8140|nr:putative glycoside hydrolase [Brevundimonas sp.]MDZ4363711.1 putative glycoside hydrolase [Brevundimonas sp.]
MKRILTLAFGLAVMGGAACAQTTGPADPSYPAFSWDRVPLYGHLGKNVGDFTDAEARFIASTYDFVTIEKGQAVQTRGSTEAGTAFAVRQLKAIRPDIKVIYYWNAFIDYPLYAGSEGPLPDSWFVRTVTGEFDTIRDLRRWDLSRPEVRQWWVDTAAREIEAMGADGIFVDALPQVAMNRNATSARYGEARAREIEEGSLLLVQELRARLGPDAVIIYNGLRAPSSPAHWADGGARYQPWATFAMLEHYAFDDATSPEQMAADIALVQEQARRGEGVVFKGWPTFNWLDESAMALPESDLRDRAEAEIDFPLASFLIAAGEHSYFSYTWGYRENHGGLQDFPILHNRLGAPQGEAVRDGWRYRRTFEHADVFVDLETRTGRIEWR